MNSENPTIIVATTFRDFKGTDNDKIQLIFLEALKRQTYTNWIMAVTLFGETNVVPTLEREGIPYVARDGEPRGHRYSNTEVWVSGIELGKKYPNHIIVWSTCDIVPDPDFFAEIARQIKPSTCGLSYPHINYHSVDDLTAEKNGRYYWEGGDLFFFSSDVFQNPKVLETLETYRNDGWGATEYYLQALGIIFCENRINIWPHKIAKVENDRELTNESREFLASTNNVNGAIVRDMAARYGLPPNGFHWINRFTTINPLHPMRFAIWFQSHFRLRILGLNYHLKRLLGRRH